MAEERKLTVDWRTVPGRYIKDPRLGHRLGRNYAGGEIAHWEWNNVWFGTDQDGFVHNGTTPRDYHADDKSLTRVFVMGGSTAMGMGVNSNSETLSAQLERFLRADSPKIRVLNCGVGSYMSWQQLSYLSLELIGYQPDVIVVLDGINDCLSSTWGNKGLRGGWIPNTHRSLDDVVQMVLQASGYSSLSHQLRRRILSSKLAAKIKTFFDELQHTASTKVEMPNKIWGEMDYSTWSVKPESVDWYIRNVRSAIGLSRANGAKIIYLLQPQLAWGSRKRTDEESALFAKIAARMPPVPTLVPEWFAMVRSRFLELRKDLHDGCMVHVEDASEWLDDVDETVYHDWNHYNARGQEVLALRIQRILRGMGIGVPKKDEHVHHSQARL
ncbi:MAG: SGNH/GDSL hydrolase family protein [Bdellovibrionota bacterium]